VGSTLGWAFASAFNPTLLAAVTAMLMLPKPRRLLFGYLLGALMTSTTLGLLIVFEFKTSGRTVSDTKHTVDPIVDITLGALLLVIAFVIGTGRDTRRRARAQRKRAAKADKPPPRWRRELEKGSARITFVVGALLTLPGASFLAGMSAISKQDYSKAQTVVAVVAFNVIMLMLIELPLLGSVIAPDWTDRSVAKLSAFLRRDGARIALWVAVVLGATLVGRGVSEALS
jgi:hypothetical protein